MAYIIREAQTPDGWEIDFKADRDWIRHATSRIGSPGPLGCGVIGIVVAVGVIYFLSRLNNRFPSLLHPISILPIAALGWMAYDMRRKGIETVCDTWEATSPSGITRYRLNRESITMSGDHGESRYALNDVLQIKKYGDVWLIEVVKGVFQYFPGFVSDPVKQFLISHCDSAQVTTGRPVTGSQTVWDDRRQLESNTTEVINEALRGETAEIEFVFDRAWYRKAAAKGGAWPPLGCGLVSVLMVLPFLPLILEILNPRIPTLPVAIVLMGIAGMIGYGSSLKSIDSEYESIRAQSPSGTMRYQISEEMLIWQLDLAESRFPFNSMVAVKRYRDVWAIQARKGKTLYLPAQVSDAFKDTLITNCQRAGVKVR
jgi:hypothetical protein